MCAVFSLRAIEKYRYFRVDRAINLIGEERDFELPETRNRRTWKWGWLKPRSQDSADIILWEEYEDVTSTNLPFSLREDKSFLSFS
jgi:hypothetical protein